MLNKKNIALLYGGNSSEREISLMSGNCVGKSLIRNGYNVTYIDTANKEEIKLLLTKQFDFAFICLHGKGGEDGSIQGFLEILNIPYSGPNIAASATAMNKARTKRIYDQVKIPTSPYVTLNIDDEYKLDEIFNELGDRVVVKAAKEGSSIGLYHVKNREEAKIAINNAFKYDSDIVIESYINGNEFTVAVLEFPIKKINEFKDKLSFNKNIAALPVIQIIPKNDYYDFASKYDEGGSQHICPAKINESLTKQLQDYAVKSHKALNCSGYSRTDFMIDKNNNIFALETNTIPGMTDKSLFPDAAKAAGINFDMLCNFIVNNK